MKPIGWIIAIIFVFGMVVAGCIAVINDEDASAPIVLVSHEYDDGYDDWGGGSDGNSGGRYEGGRSGETRQDGNENCRNFCGNTVIIPDPRGGDEERRAA